MAKHIEQKIFTKVKSLTEQGGGGDLFFGVLYLMFQHQNLDYSKCQTYPPKNAKNSLCLFCISDHSKYF